MKTTLASILALMFFIRHQLWELTADEVQSKVWNAASAFAFIFLLCHLARRERSKLIWVVVGLWLYEEALVFACTTWRLLDPWIVGPGEGQCTAKLGFRLSIISTVVVGIIAINILDRMPAGRQRDDIP